MLLKYFFRKFIEVVQQVKLFVVIILTICFISPLNVFGQQYATMPKCRQDSALREINLPILEIWTVGGVEPTATNVEAPPGMWGTSIIDNEYVYGRMIISLKDSVVYDSDDEGMKIRLRGNTSNLWEKRPYKLKLSKKADLLFRGTLYEDNDWVLKALYDGLSARVYTGLQVGRLVGLDWEPECRVVNLVINGIYRGDYLLSESVEREKCRLDIEKTGYIIEDDAYWWNEDVYFKSDMLPEQVGWTFKYPDPEDLNDSIIQNIKKCILDFENALMDDGDISQYIDVQNWAAWLLAQDILGQSDAGGTNRYLYKEDYIPSCPNATLLKMGPLWDFDGTFEISDAWSNIHRVEYSFYFKRLLQRDDFWASYVELWNDVKADLHENVIEYLGSVFNDIQQDVDKSRILNKELHPDDDRYTPVNDEIAFVSSWLNSRIAWIEEQLRKETAIEDVEDNDTNSKKVYNVYGQMMSLDMKLPKGIYIIDGKKVLIKE